MNGMRRLAAQLATATVLVAGLSFAGLASASADPDKCTVGESKVQVIGTYQEVFFCTPGIVKTAGSGPYQILSVQTNNRIWFHQHADGSGWADCFEWDTLGDHMIYLKGRDLNPGNVQMSSQATPCP